MYTNLYQNNITHDDLSNTALSALSGLYYTIMRLEKLVKYILNYQLLIGDEVKDEREIYFMDGSFEARNLF